MEEERTHISSASRRPASPVPWLVTALVVVLAGVAGWFGFSALREARAQAEKERAAVEEARNQAYAAEQAKLALEQKLKELEEERTKLTQVVQEKDAELTRLKATYDDLEDKMKAEIAQGDIRISQSEGRIQVDLVDKILFDSGDASLSSRGAGVLMRLGAVLAKVDDRSIQVSGHTDDSPPTAKLATTFPTNWELSVARAVNVVRFLQEKASVPARRLVAAGYGDARPVASNATPKGRARNRRIEILLTPEMATTKKAVQPEPKAVAAKPAKGSVKPAKGSAKSKGR